VQNTLEINRKEIRLPSNAHAHTYIYNTSFFLINQKWLLDQSDCSDGVEFSVDSLECHERDAHRARSRNTQWSLLTWFVLPTFLICCTEKILPPKPDPFFFFFSLHNLLTEAGRDSSPPAKQVRGVNENCRHHSTSPHPFHPLLWVVLASDGWPYCHSKSSSWTELARSIVAIKWTIRFQSTGKRSNGSDVETLSVTHSLPKLCEALLAPFFLRKKKSMCRCPPNCCTALDGALHKSLIRPLISTKLSHWF